MQGDNYVRLDKWEQEARHPSYDTHRLGKVTRISIMLTTTVKTYVLETWEDFEKLQEEFRTAVFETAIATFSTIITVDRLVIVIRLDIIRFVAKKNMIPVTRRVDADTAMRMPLCWR